MGVALEGTATFCVGGQFFTTSQETLMREPGCRLALIARGALAATKDRDGVVFIDRDPRYVQLLLNFLRDGWCRLPPSTEEQQELLQEVRYYQVRQGVSPCIRSSHLARMARHAYMDCRHVYVC
eukprot:356116-Chlamydomonas_euryale.AAC.9